MSPGETESGKTGEQAMSNEPKGVPSGDKEPIQYATCPRCGEPGTQAMLDGVTEFQDPEGKLHLPSYNCKGEPPTEPSDLPNMGGDETIADPDADEMPKPEFDYEATLKYRREQTAKGQCEIGFYIEGLHCTQPAKHDFGLGSIIYVCDIHSRWNPRMLRGGKCPNCGKMADHYPCNVCPGCGMAVDADNTTATRSDGTIPAGDDGKPMRVYHGGCSTAAEMFTVEFELHGTEGKRWGVCYGDNPQHAIHNFLHQHPSTQGTIVAIRVPSKPRHRT